jgi:membrane dipeptidase
MATKLLKIDMHCHPANKTWLFNRNLEDSHSDSKEFNPLATRVDFDGMEKGGVDVIMGALLLPEIEFIRDCELLTIAKEPLKLLWKSLLDKLEKDDKPNTPFEQTLQILDHFREKVKRAQKNYPNFSIAQNYNDLIKLLSEDKKVVLITIEGCHSLGRTIRGISPNLSDNLERFVQEGISMITIAHFYENDIAYPVEAVPPFMKKFLGCKKTKDPSMGLTKAGERIVEEMLENGIIVDLTHSTPLARKKVFELNNARGSQKRPLVFSHVGVAGMFDNPMNPSDEEILKIQDCGGVIGIIFYNYWLTGKEEGDIPLLPDFKPDKGIKYIIETIRHINEVTGTFDNIAIGTDLDGFTDPSDDLYDISKMSYLRTRLENEYFIGHVNNIMGFNALRVLKGGWGDPAENDASL